MEVGRVCYMKSVDIGLGEFYFVLVRKNELIGLVWGFEGNYIGLRDFWIVFGR